MKTALTPEERDELIDRWTAAFFALAPMVPRLYCERMARLAVKGLEAQNRRRAQSDLVFPEELR